MHHAPFSRRRFLELGLFGSAILVLPAGCGDARQAGVVPEAGRFLDDRQYATVRTLTGIVIPEDRDPGAIGARVVDYVDFLLGAFLVDPPRIYASGPFSGRHGGADAFAVYLPLSRVKEIAWRNHIEGSQGIAEREFNGPVKGLQQIYRDGIARLDASARAERGVDFVDLGTDEQEALFRAADAEFVDTVFAHTVEGMYAAPEYGGNANLGGWTYIDYEGDRQPVGYSRSEVEEPDPGQLPLQPSDAARARTTLAALRAAWSARTPSRAARGAAR